MESRIVNADITLDAPIGRINTTAKEWVKLREEFVQNLNGTSMEEILFLVPIPALYLFISVFIKLLVFNNLNTDTSSVTGNLFFQDVISFVIEFSTLVLPIVLQLTVFEDIAAIVIAFTSIVCVYIVIFSSSSLNNDVLYWRIPHFRGKFLHLEIISEKPISVTYLRSIIFLMTSISILAVDFKIFPRRFAKTEKYGVSVMDAGVGLYIFASAIVSKNSTRTKLKDTLHETVTLLSFGLVRCVLMQLVDYQQHTSEYGDHWNFFITLGLVKLFSTLALKISKSYKHVCGIVSLLLHQCLLSSSLEQLVMSDSKRDSWISANREGLVSLPGYLSIYLIGVSIKELIFLKRQTRSNLKNKLESMALLLLLFTIGFQILKLLLPFCMVSRRLANLPYVLWTTLLCFEYLFFGLTFEVVSIIFLPIDLHKSNIHRLLVPELLQSINHNGLVFFLVSNLLTGFVNLNFDVLNLTTYRSLNLLLSYTAINCVLVHILYLADVKIKF